METIVKDFVPGTLVYRKTDSSTKDYWMSIHKGILNGEIQCYANLSFEGGGVNPDYTVMYSHPDCYRAGINLCQVGEVVEERPATREEIEHFVDLLENRHGVSLSDLESIFGINLEHLRHGCQPGEYTPEDVQKEKEVCTSEPEVGGDTEVELMPFDKVLVRDLERDPYDVFDTTTWSADLFSHRQADGKFVTVGGVWDCCIPFKGHDYLIGTTEEPIM